MAQSGKVTLTSGAVVQIGDGTNIGTSAAVMVQNKGFAEVFILPTVDASEPAFADVVADGIRLYPAQGLNDTLANLFPDGLTYVRLWAASHVGGEVVCYHA